MKFELRPVHYDDHQWLIDLHNDPIVLRNLTNPEPITFEKHMEWWQSIIENKKELRLIFTVDDVAVGFTKFYSIDRANRNCVLGADIHKNFRGKGYAKHMWSCMLDHCFDNLNLHRVSLTTASYNIIGYKVYSGLGFKVEGSLKESLLRDGQYHDQYCMYMLKEMWKNAST